MKLTNWEVEGYRSIENGKFKPSKLNVIIGRNNTGKSTILNCIKDLCTTLSSRRTSIPFDSPNWDEIITRNTDYQSVCIYFEFTLTEKDANDIMNDDSIQSLGQKYLEECRDAGTFKSIGYEYEYSNSGATTRFSLKLPRVGQVWISNQSITDLPPQSLNKSTTGRKMIKPLQNEIGKKLEKIDSIESFRKPVPELSASRVDGLSRTGDDLVQVLDTMSRNYPDQFQKVEESYVNIMQGVTGIRTPFVRGSSNKTTIAVDEEGYTDGFTLGEISAGSREILTLITKIVKAENNKDVLLIEEPELHIHPGAQQAVYELIREVSSGDGPQIFLTTHSDVFVNRADSSNIISVKRDAKTQIEPVDENVDNLLQVLGYNKSEVLQSKGVVFVEGTSDQSVLKQFAQTLSSYNDNYESLDDLGITVRPLGGDRMKRHGAELHNSLGHIRIPHFFLTDSDDQPAGKKEKSLRKELDGAEVKVLQEYCIESYLLQNPYAIATPLDLDLEEVRDYIEGAAERPNKKSVLNDLFEDLAGREGGYDEREHSWIIAKNVRPEDIPEEIIKLIDRMQNLAD